MTMPTIAMNAKRSTRFHAIPGTADGVKQMFDRCDRPLVVVSRHGLGDNIFFSPCLQSLKRAFGRIIFCSCVNAYSTIFHLSPHAEVIYAGGINGQNLGLADAEGFARQFAKWGLDLGVPDVSVYHFGLFEPHLPYEDERAFVKGRRNMVELFGTGVGAAQVPPYHVAADLASREFVKSVIDRWLPGRELVALARYGHTDGAKNFGDCWQQSVETTELLDSWFPGRFKYLSMDFLPGDHAAEGRRFNIRSAYGFIPCDAGSLYHALDCASLLITVPTGTMLVGATIRHLKLLTLWKTMPPFHFLDPQFGSENPVHALVDNEQLANRRFASEWGLASRRALESRWRVRVSAVTPKSVAEEAALILEST